MRLLPLGVPQWLIVGEHDIPELIEHLAMYADSAQSQKEDVKLDTIQLVRDNRLAVFGSIAWPEVRAAIKSLPDESG